MDALYVQPLRENGVRMEEGRRDTSREKEEWGMEASSPLGVPTDEETDEDSEPEPQPVVRRKVSFADAFGLNLVSVKEFDYVEVTESEVREDAEGEAAHPIDEFYMSCLFTVPASPQELDQRLQAQMVELESIELLPGTTTLRGITRVANLCYSKSVHVRITLDGWNSYDELLAEYVPGSSDRRTDRFTFKYTLAPPLEREGTRVEFCLRYETSVGSFWANNKGMNYVMFCHQKAQIKEQVQEESTGIRSKRSCLKAKRRGSAAEKTWEIINTSAAEAEAPHKAEEADRQTLDRAETQTLLYREEHKPLVDSIKSRHRAARLAHVKDLLSEGRGQIPTVFSRDSTPWGNSAGLTHKCQKKQSNESPQVLTYHQIPLITLDWNQDKLQRRGTPNVEDAWTERAKLILSKVTKSVDDTREVFVHGKDENTDKETSVCDVWQAFLNGPSCTDNSSVPESEWLQTAASVSPSIDKGPQCAACSEDSQAGTDTPAPFQAYASAARQLPSDPCETSLAGVALNSADRQPAEACVSSTRDDDAATPDASERSQTNSDTDTLREFSFAGATRESAGSACSSECHERDVSEQEIERIIEGAEGDEPSNGHTAGVVTSSGETETTDMTATPESQNASAVDMISPGVSLEEGLSYSGDGEVTGTAHGATDDTLAFWETIRQATKDGERFVFSTARRGGEEGMARSRAENKESTEDVIFRPRKTEEVSRRYADENQCQEFRLKQNSEKPLKHNESDENIIRPAESREGEFDPTQTREENSQTKGRELKRDGSEIDGALHNVCLDVEQRETGGSSCTTSTKTEGSTATEAEGIQLRDEDGGEQVLVSKQTEEGPNLSFGGIIQVNQSARTTQTNTFLESTSSKDKCNPKLMEALEMTGAPSQQRTKGQNEHVGGEINPDEGTANVSKKDTSTQQPATLEMKEEDVSQRDKDDRESIRKLEIAAVGELMGNVENPRGESHSVPAELKEQELSAKVESSPHVEYRRLSEGTKVPITAENIAAIEVMETGFDKMFGEGFGERLAEEVFGPRGDISVVDGAGSKLTDGSGATRDCRILSEKDFSDVFDSLFQQEQSFTARSDGFSAEREAFLTKTGFVLLQEQTQSLSPLQADSISSVYLSQDLNPAKSQKSFNQPQKHLGPSSDKYDESSGLIWWSVFYVLSHVTRLLIGGLLAVGFYVVVFLYDFPAFFALYVFSLCWWFYKWRRHEGTTHKVKSC